MLDFNKIRENFEHSIDLQIKLLNDHLETQIDSADRLRNLILDADGQRKKFKISDVIFEIARNQVVTADGSLLTIRSLIAQLNTMKTSSNDVFDENF